MLIKAALNGDRSRSEHPRVPWSPTELATDAAAVVAAGAGAIHLHVRDGRGSESLAAEDVAAVLKAVRATCPGISLGVSTGAWILGDAAARLSAVEAWSVLPDFASVNFREEGGFELAELLIGKGISPELGISTRADAESVARFERTSECIRILIEPKDEAIVAARAEAAAIEEVLDDLQVRLPRLLHGQEGSCWLLLRDAVERGYDVRIGLEDVLVLPDSSPARDNADLVRAALEIAGDAPERSAAGRMVFGDPGS